MNLKIWTSDLNRCFLKYLWMGIGAWNKKFNLTSRQRTKNKNQKATSPHLCDNSNITHAFFFLALFLLFVLSCLAELVFILFYYYSLDTCLFYNKELSVRGGMADVEERGPLDSVGTTVHWCSNQGEGTAGFRHITTVTLCKGDKATLERDICSLTYHATLLFIITKK